MLIFRLPCGQLRNILQPDAATVLEPHQVRFGFKPLPHNGLAHKLQARSSTGEPVADRFWISAREQLNDLL
jgi:hypothetical protein